LTLFCEVMSENGWQDTLTASFARSREELPSETAPM
jgi:hypothetical protein